MKLTITIEEKAKKYVQEKGSILVISRYDIERCCVAFEDLDISYKKPEKGNYDLYVQDGLTIYIQKGIVFKDNRANVVIAGIGPFKRIAVDGLKRL